MPKIYEYLGIILSFYSDEHKPIHIHADYNGAEIKVAFFIKDGKIYRTAYTVVKGTFPNQKLKQLKKFVSQYKYDIIEKWSDYFVWERKIKFKRISKKI